MFITLAITASLLAFPAVEPTEIGASQAKTITQEVSFTKSSTPSLKKTNLTSEDLERSATQNSVMVPGDSELGFALSVVTALAPPPPPPPPAPEPEPVEVVEEREVPREQPTSRSRTNTAAPETTSNSGSNSNNSSVAPSTAVAPSNNATQSQTSSSAPTATATESSSSGDIRSQIVEASYKYIGTPYGTGAGQMDCSMFTQAVFAEFGISLPRSSAAQGSAGRAVSASEALPGDLVWWPGHVGIYLGDGQQIAARNPSTPLKVSPLYRDNPTYIRVVG